MLHIKLMGMEHRAPICTYFVLCNTHPIPLGWGRKVETFFFFLLKVVMLHIELKGMEHRVPCKHIFWPYTHPQPPDGVKRSNIFLAVSSYVAYQIKGNGAQNIMQAHTGSLRTTLTPGTGVKSQINFSSDSIVMLHIKLMGMEHRAPCKQIFCPFTHARPWSKVMLHIKLMGMEHRAPCKQIFCPFTHARPWSKGQNIFLLEVVMLHI